MSFSILQQINDKKSKINFFSDAQNILLLNGTAWVNFKITKKNNPPHHLIAKMKPKKFAKKKFLSYHDETEVVWKAPDGERLFDLKEFLKGKALLMIGRTQNKEVKGTVRRDCFGIHLTVMNLNRTLKPKHIHKKGLQISLDKVFSDQRSITNNINNALVTGRHGNIVVMIVNNLNKAILLMITFSPNGTKVLTRSHAEADLMVRGWSHGKCFELKASPGSRFVYLCSYPRQILVYQIQHERKIIQRKNYVFEDRVIRPTPKMSGYLSHIFCYSEHKLIVVMNFRKKSEVKLMVFTYNEEKSRFVRSKVKNSADFDFRGQIKFYRKNGRVYFFDQKQSIYRLTLS